MIAPGIWLKERGTCLPFSLNSWYKIGVNATCCISWSDSKLNVCCDKQISFLQDHYSLKGNFSGRFQLLDWYWRTLVSINIFSSVDKFMPENFYLDLNKRTTNFQQTRSIFILQCLQHIKPGWQSDPNYQTSAPLTKNLTVQLMVIMWANLYVITLTLKLYIWVCQYAKPFNHSTAW